MPAMAPSASTGRLRSPVSGMPPLEPSPLEPLPEPLSEPPPEPPPGVPGFSGVPGVPGSSA